MHGDPKGAAGRPTPRGAPRTEGPPAHLSPPNAGSLRRRVPVRSRHGPGRAGAGAGVGARPAARRGSSPASARVRDGGSVPARPPGRT